MLREYVDWWSTQMLDLVPARLREAAADETDALLIEPEDPGGGKPPVIGLTLLRSRRESALGRFALDPAGLEQARHAALVPGRTRETRLRLPGSLLLEKQLTLPLAAERDLERVLAYEMDRETPFAADEVWWSFAVEQRDRVQARLGVRLSIVPKTALAALLDLLRGAGLSPTALELPAPEGGMRQIALAGSVRQRGPWRVRPLTLAASCCAILAVLAVILPFVRQSVALAEVENRIVQLKPQVDQAEALERQLSGSGGADVLRSERGAAGRPDGGAGRGDPPAAGRHLSHRLHHAAAAADAERPVGRAGQADRPAGGEPDLQGSVLFRAGDSPPGRAEGCVLDRRRSEALSMDMSLPTGQRGRLLALAVTGVLLLALWLVIASPLLDFYADRADRLAQREAVAARMERLAASLPDIKERAEAASDDGATRILTLEGGSDAVAAAGLQNVLQDMATAVGASLSSVEIVPGDTVGAYRRVGLKLSLNVPWTTLVALMQAIEQASPPMLLDDVEIHASPVPNAPPTQPLDAEFTVYAFRAATPPLAAP